MSDPRELAPPQSAPSCVTPASGYMVEPTGSRGDAAVKHTIRQTFGYDAQVCLVEASPSRGRNTPVPVAKAPVGVFGAEHADPGRDGMAAMRKDMGRGKAPDDLAIPRANQRRLEGRGGEPDSGAVRDRDAAGHRGAIETTAFTDGRGGVVVRSGGEVRPESGQGVGAKGVVDLGVGVDGASFKVGGDRIGGKRPEDTLPAAPGQRAPIADQDVYSVGGSAGVSGLGGDAAKVKYDGELRGGRAWSVPGKDGLEGNAALRSVDGGATVRAGAGGIEAVHGRAQVSETTADGTKTAGGVRGGWDAVRGTGTVGGSIGRTGADGRGGGIEADIVVGNGTTGGKVGGHVTGKNGQRVGGSVGGSETWRVSPPRRDGDAWVVDVVQASTADGGLGGGKNALQVGAGASGFESRTISRRFPTQAAAAAFQAKLESVPPMKRDAELAALSDPTAMNVGDTAEKASGSGGGAQVGVQGGIVSVSVGGQVSGSQTLRFKKLDADTIEVRIGTVASKGGNVGGGTAGGRLEYQSNERDEQVDVVLVDLRDPKSRNALAALEEGGIETFLKRHGDGQGKLWRWSQRHTKTTTTEGRSAAVLGLSAGQTGSVEQSRTEDGEGNLLEGVKGTGKQDVAMFGAHHSKSGAVDVTHENGELHGVTLTANAQSSRSGDTARAMGSMLGVQGGDTKGAKAATLTASKELSDEQLRLLWEICKTSGTVTLPGAGERQAGRWRIQARGKKSAETLFRAAEQGFDAFVKALPRYVAAEGPDGFAALVQTLRIGDGFDVSAEGDAIIGKANMEARAALLAKAEAALSAGRLPEARAMVTRLGGMLKEAELQLTNGAYLPHVMPGARVRELEQNAREKKEFQAFEARLGAAEAKAAPAKAAERKQAMNGAGSPSAVCEVGAVDDGAMSPESAHLAMIPPMFRDLGRRDQTLADPRQLDPAVAAANKAWQDVLAQKAGLDAVWASAETAFNGFRVWHYAYLHYQPPGKMRTLGEAMAADNPSFAGVRAKARAGGTNLRHVRNTVLGLLREVESQTTAISLAGDPGKQQGRVAALGTLITKVLGLARMVATVATQLETELKAADTGGVFGRAVAGLTVPLDHLWTSNK